MIHCVYPAEVLGCVLNPRHCPCCGASAPGRQGEPRDGAAAGGIAKMKLQSEVVMSVSQTAAEQELADLIVSSLNLESIKPGDIAPEAPLFGGDLGLDSIDALELALAVSKRYGFQLRSDNSDNRRIFSSLRALSAHIEQHRAS